MTPAIMARSYRLDDASSFSASAIRVRISSSVTRSPGSELSPKVRKTARPEASNNHTIGDAIAAITVIAGATFTAIASGFLRAICFGTSSPIISEKYAMTARTNPTPRVSATPTGKPNDTPHSASRSPSVTPENAPDKIPTKVMPSPVRWKENVRDLMPARALDASRPRLVRLRSEDERAVMKRWQARPSPGAH